MSKRSRVPPPQSLARPVESSSGHRDPPAIFRARLGWRSTLRSRPTSVRPTACQPTPRTFHLILGCDHASSGIRGRPQRTSWMPGSAKDPREGSSLNPAAAVDRRARPVVANQRRQAISASPPGPAPAIGRDPRHRRHRHAAYDDAGPGRRDAAGPPSAGGGNRAATAQVTMGRRPLSVCGHSPVPPPSPHAPPRRMLTSDASAAGCACRSCRTTRPSTSTTLCCSPTWTHARSATWSARPSRRAGATPMAGDIRHLIDGRQEHV